MAHRKPRRHDTGEIIEAINAIRAHLAQIDPALWRDILETRGAKLPEYAARYAAMRTSLVEALKQLSEDEIKALKDLLRGGKGQVARDVERLMKEGLNRVLYIDGKPIQMSVPGRPSFLGAVPSNVPAKQVGDIGASPTKEGYAYKTLPMGGDAITSREFDDLAKGLQDSLRADFAPAAVGP